MEQITIQSSVYAVFDMQQDYPFGIMQQVTQQTVLVRKNLVFQHQHHLKIIQKMCEILADLENEHLVAFIHAQSNQKNICSFYYEYIPLTIDKWLLDLGQDMLQQLEFELTSLAGYLTENGVKFVFDPKCVGLSKDIKMKYFLKEFTIDNENKLSNYKDNERRISSFFHQLRQNQLEVVDQKPIAVRIGSFDSIRKVDSFQTRQSWDMKSCKSDGSTSSKQCKNTLSERLQDTKKKSMELLARIKSIKAKH